MKQNTSELKRPTSRIVEKLCCVEHESLTRLAGAIGSDSHVIWQINARNNIQIASNLVSISSLSSFFKFRLYLSEKKKLTKLEYVKLLFHMSN
jgi:hypothetical protein